MRGRELEDLLRDATREQIISADQAARLRALADSRASDVAPGAKPAGRESPRGLNTVSVAYGIGALLILFAFGWFLFERWEKLGVWGVLGVVAAYAVVLSGSAVWLWRHDFRFASGIATMLAVSLTPLLAWDLQRMAGLWPDARSSDPLAFYPPWMAWRWIIVELSVILVALLVLRRRPFVALSWPIAVAGWGLSYHVGDVLRGEWFDLGHERWMRLAAALTILAVADLVERWQARASRDGRAPDGDFATAFWFTGLLSFSFAYTSVWSHAGAWKHLLPLIAVAFVAISLWLGRRLILVFGMAGIFGYLGYLAGDVFRNLVSFPVLLAGLGVLVILTVVWMQRSFPKLVERIDASRGDDRRGLPWSAPMSLLPAFFAVGMAVMSLADVAEERAQQEFRQRLHILRMHSGSIRAPTGERAAPPAATPDTSPG